ncbi:MAG: PrsW family intramembrane metalloprotease [Candidatus Lambdaproteobacteria bacterium]|nr:PrsW family intramembrane metalloprotease [Candidatus Lambdaproteobacteria bacterium]
MLLVAIAVSPGIALIWFFHANAAGAGERKLLLAVLFLLGGAAAGPSLVLNHAIEKYTLLWSGAPEAAYRIGFWLLGPGLNEEVAKLLVLLAVVYPRQSFRTPYQGLLAAATVATGFAVLENLFYLERYGTATLLLRSVLTVPAHAFFTIPLGLLLGFARRAESLGAKYACMLGGLVIAAALHGLYDVLLSMPGPWLSRLAYVQVALMGLAILWIVRHVPLGGRRPVAEGGA